jgi:hypothetical protein
MVAYERAALETQASGSIQPANPFIELFDVAARQTRIVSPSGHVASNPVWAPNGWLSYFDADRQAVVVDDLAGGTTLVPNANGADWVWLPDGTGLIFPEITPDTTTSAAAATNLDSLRIFSQLMLVTVKTNNRLNLSGPEQVEDYSPAVSPDGAQLAFARNYFDARWTPGRQMWILNLKDAALRQLTQSSNYGVSSIHWSSDGARLVYMRFHETTPSDPPEIWSINPDGSGAQLLAAGGYLPQWLP